MKNNKSSVWDKTTPVEKSAYLTKEGPQILKPRNPQANGGKLNLVDLFCGCGGFSAGFRKAGFKTILGLDHHLPSCETFALNHPEAAVIIGDILEVPEQSFLEAVTDQHVHVVTAGVPCQGFSLMNRKQWAEDERNFLFHQFIRVVKLLQPDVVLLENVLGLRKTANGEFERAIKDAITTSGYRVSFRVLNAAEHGVPQRRERVFFMGVREGDLIPWPNPTHAIGFTTPPVSVWDAIGDLPPLEAGQAVDGYSEEPWSEYQKLMRGACDTLYNHEAPKHQQTVINKIASTKPGSPIYPRFKQRIRLAPEEPSPTQVSGGIRPQYQFGHPTQARGLTVRERCRIQSFPDDYIICGGMVQGRVQTGNAVPPLLAEAIAQRIAEYLNDEKRLEPSEDRKNPSFPTQMELFK